MSYDIILNMIRAKTKITIFGESKYILIPHEVLTDSIFPFRENEELEIEIRGKSVVITPFKR